MAAPTLTATAQPYPSASVQLALTGVSDASGPVSQLDPMRANILRDGWVNMANVALAASTDTAGAPNAAGSTRVTFTAANVGCATNTWRNVVGPDGNTRRTFSVWAKGTGVVHLEARNAATQVVDGKSASVTLTASWTRLELSFEPTVNTIGRVWVIMESAGTNVVTLNAPSLRWGWDVEWVAPVWTAATPTTPPNPPALIPNPNGDPWGLEVRTVGTSDSPVILEATMSGLIVGTRYRVSTGVTHRDLETSKIILETPGGSVSSRPIVGAAQTLTVTFTATATTATVRLKGVSWRKSASTSWVLTWSTWYAVTAQFPARSIIRTDANGTALIPVTAELGVDTWSTVDHAAALLGTVTYEWSGADGVTRRAVVTRTSALPPHVGGAPVRLILTETQSTVFNGSWQHTTGLPSWQTRGQQPRSGSVTVLVDDEESADAVMQAAAIADLVTIMAPSGPRRVLVRSTSKAPAAYTALGWFWTVRLDYEVP